MKNGSLNEEKIYINEIIRINYKCNWSCKFCNVLKTNNYGDNDISNKEVVSKILQLLHKYNTEQRGSLILSFSGGEPTINKNLPNYIKLAKKLGIGIVQIQTNGTMLFKNKNYINELIDTGLDEVFLAQHSSSDIINKKIGIYYNIDDFKKWVVYIKNNNIHNKIHFQLNIVITKINLNSLYDFITFSLEIGFINILKKIEKNSDLVELSFGFVQPNGYAEINSGEVLLEYNSKETEEISKIISLCERNNIYLDFHYTAPPLCIFNLPKYNLEFQRLKQLEYDKEKLLVNKGNLESYKKLWGEKQKFEECKNCKNNNYCLGFYKNWIEFVGKDYVKTKIINFINS